MVDAYAVGTIGETICRMPRKKSYQTSITPVPARSAAVTAPPPNWVRGRETPFSVSWIGRVPVVPSGMAEVMATTNSPILGMRRKPRPMFTEVSVTVAALAMK